MVSISSAHDRSTEASSTLECVGSSGNSAMRRPSRVSRPSCAHAPASPKGGQRHPKRASVTQSVTQCHPKGRVPRSPKGGQRHPEGRHPKGANVAQRGVTQRHPVERELTHSPHTASPRGASPSVTQRHPEGRVPRCVGCMRRSLIRPCAHSSPIRTWLAHARLAHARIARPCAWRSRPCVALSPMPRRPSRSGACVAWATLCVRECVRGVHGAEEPWGPTGARVRG